MKRIPALLLALVLSLLCLFSYASANQDTDLSYGDFLYRLQADGTVMLTGYTGENGDLTVPSRIGGGDVTVIGPETFKSNNSLIRVTLPDTITGIGDYAFFYCRSLSFINLPDSIQEIGRNPFAAFPRSTFPRTTRAFPCRTMCCTACRITGSSPTP